jgi:hypothetical protein
MEPGRCHPRITLSLMALPGRAVLWAALTVLSCSTWSDKTFRAVDSQQTRPDNIEAARLDLPPMGTNMAMRPVYPFSVLPGGAYSAAELRAKSSSDAIAAIHYQPLQLTLLRTVKATSPLPVYVSYRKGRSIYWTRQPVRLAKGEILLTDGTLFVRARCGNRISTTPQEPVSPQEPRAGILDDPERWMPGPQLERSASWPNETPSEANPVTDTPSPEIVGRPGPPPTSRPGFPPTGNPWFPIPSAGCTDPESTCPSVPEIDSGSAVSALCLLIGVSLLIRGRRKSNDP